MDNWLIAILSLVCFCFCARNLIKGIAAPIPAHRRETYNVLALKFQKMYKIMAWGLMTIVFIAALASSYYQVFTGQA